MPEKVSLTQEEGVEWTYKVSAGDNKARSTRTYTDDVTGWESRCPKLGSRHPNFAELFLVDIEARGIPGGMVSVSLIYESVDEEATYPGRDPGRVKRYDMEVTTEEEHILAHQRYADLSAAEREALLAISNGTFEDNAGNSYESKVTSARGKEALAKIRKGITHYLVPGIVWVEKFNTHSLGDLDIANVGNIDSPPGSPPSGGSRNYLYIGATGSMSEDGESFSVERRWRLSGRNGWDPELYND